MSGATGIATRTVRFHGYGEPADVLRLEETQLPAPARQRVSVKVQACGLHPADWALCQGLFAGSLPRGIGLEAAGTVDAIGDEVTDVEVGQFVFGPVDFAGTASAGASDYAILQHWTPVPNGLDPIKAAALPMAVAIAYGSLDCLGVKAGTTVLINGAGTTVGSRRHRSQRCEEPTLSSLPGPRLQNAYAPGAIVTSYGQGLAERASRLPGMPPDVVLDTAPVSGALPCTRPACRGSKAGHDDKRFHGCKELGVRATLEEPGMRIRYDVLGEFAELTKEGKFSIPAKTFSLTDWKKHYHSA